MAFNLTKDEIKIRDEIIAALNAAKSKLEDEISAYNERLEALKEPVEAALAAYNEEVEKARSFAEDIATQADSDFSDKSEKWQEGDKGSAANDWKTEWENLSFDAIEIEFPEELIVEDPNHAESLEQAPETVED